jgi:hypothetical protein
LSRSSPRRPKVGGSEAKNARAPCPRRDAKRLDSGRAWMENVGASLAKRSKLTRSLMSACSFGKMSVANAERGTSEGMPSRDRATCSLFDRASATQPAQATVGRCGRASLRLWLSRVQTRRERENRTQHLCKPTTKRVLTTTWVRCRRRLHRCIKARNLMRTPRGGLPVSLISRGRLKKKSPLWTKAIVES